MKKAFTIIEILIVISIILILSVMATIGFSNMRINKAIDITAQDILFALEDAKSQSLSGKGGENHGVYFGANSYIFFNGSSYSASDPENKTVTIDQNLEIVNTATNSSIIFSRITGNANGSSSVIVREKNDTDNLKTITIGALGDINMIE